ncbi:MAG: TRAP transporter small permease [Betaproteobacteria bacterium]|jgi:TRAP-type mannitol/chloroaromatic compound transport system permease small subunit|nr:MAG: TRAP transporter small permease [Betaproteobacteria bacterium]
MSDRTPVTRFVHAVGNAASYLFLLIVAISAFEVLMRYVMGQPTIWVHELSIAFAATCFVIGGPYVHASRRHITISYAYEKMPLTMQGWARLLSSLLTLVFLLFLSYAATVQGWQAVQHAETTGTALNWPLPAYLKSLFALCAAIMSVQTLMHVIEDVERIRRRSYPGSKP